MAGVIEIYLKRLRRDLDFNPALARRVASEVESHLWDAAEADPAWPSVEAEERAVARFGCGQEIAARFTAAAVARQTRRTWRTLAATVVITFVAMRLRVIWLEGCGGSLADWSPWVDRYAFVAALGTGIIGWIGFRRSWIPPTLCLAGLAASIGAGFVRADLFSGGAPLPVLATALVEMVVIGLLARHVSQLHRQLTRSDDWRKTE